AALATSAGRILELLPETDPSPDFTDRVLAALPLPSARQDPTTPRLRAPVAAAVVATVALAVSGVYALAGSQAPEEPTRAEPVEPTADFIAAPLISRRHQI